PGVPEVVSPIDGATLTDQPSPVLVVGGSVDPDSGDVVTYGFRAYRDRLCTDMVASAERVPAVGGRAEWCVDVSLADGDYWWRAYGDDGKEWGLMTPAARFTVETSEEGLPREVRLHGPSPNPFGNETTIRYDLPTRSETRLGVFDLMGRQVRVLIDGERGPGRLSVTWDGRDGVGGRTANGFYVMKLTSCGSSSSVPVVVLGRAR
ncbi:hypothetical protein JXA88_15375, partial [Candidatus Fermentibacteria bacterium]|nr:hypothetical protein [Candidatus Fermentibacteria bacterium]